jgi:hypothetical protein
MWTNRRAAPTKAEQALALELGTVKKLVKEYIGEMSNPAPCHVTRGLLRKKLAEAVGDLDPAEHLRRWHSKR